MSSDEGNIMLLAELEAIAEDYQKRLNNVYKEHDGLKEENEGLQRDLDEDLLVILTLKNKINDLESQIEKCQLGYDKLKNECHATDEQLCLTECGLRIQIRDGLTNMQTIENLRNTAIQKERIIVALNAKINRQVARREAYYGQIEKFQQERCDLVKDLECTENKIISQQQEEIEKRKLLSNMEEKQKTLSIQCSYFRNSNSQLKKGIVMLQDEQSKLLADTYAEGEIGDMISRDLKKATESIEKLKEEFDHLLEVHKNQKDHYIKKDIEFQARLEDHEKFINYLHIKAQELKEKKDPKSWFAKVVAFTRRWRKLPEKEKETNSILYSDLQRELEKEKQESKRLREELEREHLKACGQDLKQFSEGLRNEGMAWEQLATSKYTHEGLNMVEDEILSSYEDDDYDEYYF